MTFLKRDLVRPACEFPPSAGEELVQRCCRNAAAGRKGYAPLSPALYLGLLLSALFSLTGCQWMSQALLRREDESRKLAAQAAQAENQGDWNQAAGLLSQALHRNPGNAELHLRLARVSLEQNQPALARRHLLAGEAADPKNAETLVGMARVALKLQDEALAFRLSKRAVAVQPSFVPALLLQADLEERRGHRDSAMAVYHHILTVAPRNETAKIRLAGHQIAMGHPDRAAVLLRSVCQSPQTSSEAKTDAYRQLGQAYARAGRWTDAVAALQNVVRQPSATAADYQRLMAARRHQTGEGAVPNSVAGANGSDRTAMDGNVSAVYTSPTGSGSPVPDRR